MRYAGLWKSIKIKEDTKKRLLELQASKNNSSVDKHYSIDDVVCGLLDGGVDGQKN